MLIINNFSHAPPFNDMFFFLISGTNQTSYKPCRFFTPLVLRNEHRNMCFITQVYVMRFFKGL